MAPRKRKEIPFSKILNSLMDERNIGLRQLSKACNVPESTISDWRSGVVPSDFAAVKRIADIFEVSLSFILTGVEDVQKQKSLTITEIFEDGGTIYNGYAHIKIQKLIPRGRK